MVNTNGFVFSSSDFLENEYSEVKSFVTKEELLIGGGCLRVDRSAQSAEEAEVEFNRHAAGFLDGEHPMGLDGGFEFSPLKISKSLVPDTVMVRDYGTIWNEARFLEARQPIHVGRVSKEFSRVSAGISCHSMVVKMPGTPFRVPAELRQFLPAINMCAAFEAAVNPIFDESFAYLGIDQSYVIAGKRQRSAEKHTDGIQGPRIQPKIPIEHTYLCVDRDPTRIYTHPFNLAGAKADSHYLTPIFEKEADEDRSIQMEPYVISLLDAYTVHCAVPASKSGIRTLMKLSFSTRLFDRRGNSHNYLFDYQWETHSRPVPTNLIGYVPRDCRGL